MNEQGQKWNSWLNQVQEFCEERDWDQFHNPKDLAIGLSLEASELLECFRYKSLQEIETLMKSSHFKAQVGDELVDVLFYVLRFARMYDFDLAARFQDKMIRNAKKYPVEKSRGNNTKYTEL